ncbi:hypothetical protein BC829DRAFT_177157 [Chytridium lagenaria]|nr:hypothetical protein BC829DRAFT_177157 [Chytridium lagenaria]
MERYSRATGIPRPRHLPLHPSAVSSSSASASASASSGSSASSVVSTSSSTAAVAGSSGGVAFRSSPQPQQHQGGSLATSGYVQSMLRKLAAAPAPPQVAPYASARPNYTTSASTPSSPSLYASPNQSARQQRTLNTDPISPSQTRPAAPSSSPASNSTLRTATHSPPQKRQQQQQQSSSPSQAASLSVNVSPPRTRAPSSLPPSPLTKHRAILSSAPQPIIDIIKNLIPYTTSLIKSNPWIVVAAPCLALIASNTFPYAQTIARLAPVDPFPPPITPQPNVQGGKRKLVAKRKAGSKASSLPPPPSPAPNATVISTLFGGKTGGGGGAGSPSAPSGSGPLGPAANHDLSSSPIIRLLLFVAGYRRNEWSFWWSLTWRLGAAAVVVVAISTAVIVVSARRRRRGRGTSGGRSLGHRDDAEGGPYAMWRYILTDEEFDMLLEMEGPGRGAGKRALSSLPALPEDRGEERRGYAAGLLSLFKMMYARRVSSEAKDVDASDKNGGRQPRGRDSKLDPEIGGSPLQARAILSPKDTPALSAPLFQPYSITQLPSSTSSSLPYVEPPLKSSITASKFSASPSRSLSSSPDLTPSTPPRAALPTIQSPALAPRSSSYYHGSDSPWSITSPSSSLLPAIPNVADISLSPLMPRSGPLRFDDKIQEIDREIQKQERRDQKAAAMARSPTVHEEDEDDIPLVRKLSNPYLDASAPSGAKLNERPP